MTCPAKLANGVSPQQFKKKQINPLPSERFAKAKNICVQWRPVKKPVEKQSSRSRVFAARTSLLSAS